jgi:hypothetical protein
VQVQRPDIWGWHGGLGGTSSIHPAAAAAPAHKTLKSKLAGLIPTTIMDIWARDFKQSRSQSTQSKKGGQKYEKPFYITHIVLFTYLLLVILSWP